MDRERTNRPGDMTIEAGDVFEQARTGGRHAGFLKQLPNFGERQLIKAIDSLSELAELHVDKINHPERYVPSWNALRETHRASILKGWEAEVRSAREQVAIIEVYRRESGK